ncbi:unnamed protein product [Blepharisma stoltei]|uniref:Uncharacterized protein n=1 Tax=Blepharisma stoltei TaxID=1481888 RepID=A0AAU9JAD7_9CILI|nr:unnamed protein product [Blepharisma stoltei]
MGSSQSYGKNAGDTFYQNHPESINLQWKSIENLINQIKASDIKEHKLKAFAEILTICSSPNFLSASQILPSFEIMFSFCDEDLILDTIDLLLNHIQAYPESINFLISHGLLQDLSKLCTIGSEEIAEASIKFLKEVTESNEDARLILYFSGTIEILSKLIISENLEIRTNAIDIIYKVYYPNEITLGKLISSETLTNLITTAKSSYWIDRFSIAVILDKTIEVGSEEQIEKIIELGVLDSLLENLTSESVFLINSSLNCLERILEIGEKDRMENPYKILCKKSPYFGIIEELSENNSLAKAICEKYFSNKKMIRLNEFVNFAIQESSIREEESDGDFSSTDESIKD